MNKFIALLCAAAVTIGSGFAIALADDDADFASDSDYEEVVESGDAAGEGDFEEADTDTAGEEDTDADSADTEEVSDSSDAVQSEAASDTASEEASEVDAKSETEETADADTTEAARTADEATESVDAQVPAAEETTESYNVANDVEIIEKTGVNPFEDCQDKWFTGYVTFAYENGIVKGVDETHYNPEGNVTRAQLALMLYRVHSNVLDIVTEDGYWAQDAKDWAIEHHLMDSFAGDDFGDYNDMTREEIVTTLYNAYRINNAVENAKSIESFPDYESVSEYAVEAMEWATGNRIIKGVSDIWIAPQNNVTRAQTATILQRYLQNVTFTDVKFDEEATVKVVEVEEAAELEKRNAATVTQTSDTAEATADTEEAVDAAETVAEAAETAETTEAVAEPEVTAPVDTAAEDTVEETATENSVEADAAETVSEDAE